MARALFLLLVLQPFMGHGITTMALVILASWACTELHFKIPRRAAAMLIIPGAMIALGLLGAPAHNLRDVLKDGWYYMFPALAVLTGYLLAHRCKRVAPVLMAFVAAGVLLSCWHLAEIVAHSGSLASGDINDVRTEVGAGYVLSAVSPLILFLSRRYGVALLPSRARILPISIYCITLTSVVFTFSRTIIISLLLSLIAGLGWLTAKRKRGLIMMALFVGAVLGLSAVIPEDTASFFGKLARSREEVAFSDFSTTTDAIQYWRAYETLKALQTYGGGTFIQQAVGLGFGQLVDIGFEVQLGDTAMSEIPVFHNGYIYVLVKTGYVGLVLFLIYLVRFYTLGARSAESPDPQKQLLGGLTMAMTTTVVVSTFVISGWFNPGAMCSVMLLMGSLVGFLSKG